MASEVAEILDDLVDALRATGKFSLVTLGEAGSATNVPRCSVIYESTESFLPDDSATARWGRLRATVSIRTRSVDVVQGVKRAAELSEQAMDSLLVDPFRGGRCRDLPVGRATEIARCRLSRGLKRPEIEMTFDIRCHFETEKSS